MDYRETSMPEDDPLHWKEKLTPEQYHVCREGATEKPFSGKYYHNTESGVYTCVCCDQSLFATKDQFDAGCGWPSYSLPVNRSAIYELTDASHNMIRTEVRCSNCDAHLGHVFDDGAKPSGLRYCINSVALVFKKY